MLLSSSHQSALYNHDSSSVHYSFPNHAMHITGRTSGTPSLCYPVGKHAESSTSERCSENEMHAKVTASSAKYSI